jgi:tape measure domain-containing protein
VAEVGRIQIEVDARQVDKATRALNDLGLKAQATGGKVNKYEKETKQATRATDKMSKSSKRLTRTLSFLGVGLGGLTFGAVARQIERATTQLANIEATMQVAAGSSEAAGRQIAFIREESERLGLFFPTVAKQMAQFSAAARGTSITSQELRTIFTGISEASRAMGLTAPEAEGAMKALQQMMSKGKVSAEELRQQLGERMPGSIQIMAASLDVGTQELFKMMEQGKLLSDEVLPKFGKELSDVFSAQARLQSAKIAASIQRLQTAFFDLMSQGNLFGAARAIDSLADTITDPTFQKDFDTVIQKLSNFAGAVGENIDKIITLTKILGVVGIASFTKKIFGAVGALFDMSTAAKASTVVVSGLAAKMTFLSRGLSFLGGPEVLYFFFLTDQTQPESLLRGGLKS